MTGVSLSQIQPLGNTRLVASGVQAGPPVPAVPVEPVVPAVPAPVVLPLPVVPALPEPVVLPVPALPELELPAVPDWELPALPVPSDGFGVAHPNSSSPLATRGANDERMRGPPQ